MAHVGFLGAGNMGRGMASRLLAAGHTVSVYNRTKEKVNDLVGLGAVHAKSPREAAKGADAVISMVGDDKASSAVWLGEQGALSATLKPGAFIIECSTLSHDYVIELSERVKGMNLIYIDAPVTGLPEAAAKGELTLFLGGSRENIDSSQEYLRAISIEQLHFGEIGAGTAYKLIVNLMGSIQIHATAEALVVAEHAGLDLDMTARALGAGGAGSPAVARLSKAMVSSLHDRNVLFNAYWRLKDTKYGVDFSNKMGVHTELGNEALRAFQNVISAGHGDLSESKIIDLVRTEKPI